MIEYKLIRSKRKTIVLLINEACEVEVRAPFHVPKSEIDKMVNQKSDWIEEHIPLAEKRKERADLITPELIRELTKRAKADIPPRVEKYASIMGVEPTGVKITSARKRFGSCSGRNSLCFSCLLMLYPPEAIDSVVVHELAHIRHHDHSKAFYDFILRFMPDYRERERILKRPPQLK